MNTKFSVFSKFYKYLNLKPSGVRRLFRNNCKSSLISRCFTKNSINTVIPEGTNNKIFSKDVTKFRMTRNMSSDQNNKDEGHGNLKENNIDLINKSKKKHLRRRSKVKSLKSSHKKCKRCIKKNDLTKEKLITEIIPSTNVSQKVEFPEVIKDQHILHSELPPQKLHVEFMESQNLIDFNPPTQPLNTKNIKQSIIDIKITPIIPSNDSIKKDIKNTIYNSESKNLTKSNRDKVNKPIKIDQQEKNIEKSFQRNSNNEDNIGKLIEKASRSENIRVLYQAQPKRKTKIRIAKIKQTDKSKKLKAIKAKTDSPKTSLIILESSDSLIGKGILFPTELGEYPHVKKIQSKHFKYKMMNPFATLRKGILYPTELGAIRIKMPFKPKPALKNSEINLFGGTAPVKIKNMKKPLPNIDTDLLQIPMTKLETKADILQENNKNTKLLPNNPNHNNIMKTITNRKISEKPCSTSISSINRLKLSHQSDKENFVTTSTDKQKNNKNSNNQISQVSRASFEKNIPKNNETGVIKINKFTKYKISNKGGNYGGSKRGNGGDNKDSYSGTTTEAPPSKFWRNISITILPLIFGLTIYTMCNIEAVDMFKQMRDARSSEDPITMKILPTFYGKKSKNQAISLKDSDKRKENIEVENLKENITEDPVEEPRLDEV